MAAGCLLVLWWCCGGSCLALGMDSLPTRHGPLFGLIHRCDRCGHHSHRTTTAVLAWRACVVCLGGIPHCLLCLCSTLLPNAVLGPYPAVLVRPQVLVHVNTHLDCQLTPAAPPVAAPAPRSPYSIRGALHVVHVINLGGKPMQSLISTTFRSVTIHNSSTGTCLLYTPPPGDTTPRGGAATSAATSATAPSVPVAPADGSDSGPRIF